MAFFQCNFFSPTLCFNTDINVFIPTPNSDELMNKKRGGYFYSGAKFPVMYLLHGAYGDYTDWPRLSSVEKYAQEHKLAVVMPSASNSFYQNMTFGSNYLTYISEELPRFVEKMFPVSKKREYTFTAGLSMGGYGALRVALERPDKFSAAISLSGAIDYTEVMRVLREGTIKGPSVWEELYASGRMTEDTDADLFLLAKRHIDAKTPLPRLFISCGVDDFVYPANQSGTKKFAVLDLDMTYEQHPGIHDWDYWDLHINRAIQWLNLPGTEVNG